MSEHRIAGEWRGYYSYIQNSQLGSAFNIFVIENDGLIEGSIIDEDDTAGRKASFVGGFTFPHVHFTKTYVGDYSEVHKDKKTNEVIVYSYSAPVEYKGTMSGDGKTINGTWEIEGTRRVGAARGNWTAYRIMEDESKASEGTAKQAKGRNAGVG